MPARKSSRVKPKARFQSLASTSIADWRLYLATALAWPLSLTPLVGQVRGVQLEAAAHLFLAFLVAHSFLVLFLWLGRLSWWRARLAKKRPGFVIWMVFLGTILASIIGQQVLSGFGYEGAVALELVLIRFALVVLIILGYANLEQYRSQLRELNASQNQLIDLIAQTEQTISAELSGSKKRLNEVSLELQSVGNEDPKTVSSKLLAFSESLIRPWSHELRTVSSVNLNQARAQIMPNWAEVLSRLVSRSLIKPLLTAVAVASFSVSLTVRDVEDVKPPSEMPTGEGLQVTIDTESFLRSMLELGTLFLATLVVAILLRRLGDSGRFVRMAGSALKAQLLALVLLASLTVVLTSAIFSIFGLGFRESLGIFDLMLFSVPVFAIALFVGLVRTIREARESVLEESKEAKRRLEWEAARANQELWQLRKSISNALHGPLRAQLLAAYLTISKEPDKASAVIAELLPRFDEHSQKIGQPAESGDPLKLMWQTLELWRDVCEVTFDATQELLDSLRADPIASNMLSEIVNESVSNAIKHGKAKSVRVELGLDSYALAVTVVNDGEYNSGASPGLGSKIMDESTLSWSLEREAEYTVLRATIPLSSI